MTFKMSRCQANRYINDIGSFNARLSFVYLKKKSWNSADHSAKTMAKKRKHLTLHKMHLFFPFTRNVHIFFNPSNRWHRVTYGSVFACVCDWRVIWIVYVFMHFLFLSASKTHTDAHQRENISVFVSQCNCK